MPKPAGYTRIQISLHWVIAILIAAQFLLHEPMEAAWRIAAKGGTPEFDPIVAAHVFGGILILLLAIWRIALKIKRGSPAFPAGEPRWQKIAASASHGILYLLMILIPASGISAWFLGVLPAAEAHEVMGTILLLVVALHFIAALYHRFILKSGVMERMLRAEK